MWIGVVGSRTVVSGLAEYVEQAVKAVLAEGNGIVTGGALGVDQIAAETALAVDPSGRHLRVMLPVPLDVYRAHYLKRADEGVISHSQASKLIAQLEQVKSAGALQEMPAMEVNHATYYARTVALADASDELLGFRVGDSPGTQLAINRARKEGKPVKEFLYRRE